jgi:hypothetical protein
VGILDACPGIPRPSLITHPGSSHLPPCSPSSGTIRGSSETRKALWKTVFKAALGIRVASLRISEYCWIACPFFYLGIILAQKENGNLVIVSEQVNGNDWKCCTLPEGWGPQSWRWVRISAPGQVFTETLVCLPGGKLSWVSFCHTPASGMHTHLPRFPTVLLLQISKALKATPNIFHVLRNGFWNECIIYSLVLCSGCSDSCYLEK